MGISSDYSSNEERNVDLMMRVFKWVVLGLILGLVVYYFWPEKTYRPFTVSPDYQNQVDNYVVPDLPPDWVWNEFAASDGTKIRWGETGNRNAAKATIIWIPGYTATLDMYGEHFDALARRGYHILGIDMRGQGGSQRYRAEYPEKLWVENFHVYARDLKMWLDSQELPVERTVILSGISFGGHVALRAKGDFIELPVDGMFLMAPAIQPRTEPYSFERAMQVLSWFNWFGKDKRYVFGQGDWKPEADNLEAVSDCSSNPKRLHYRDVVFTRMPEQRVGGVTHKWFYEFLHSSEYIYRRSYLSQIKVPVTIITAETDAYVENSAINESCEKYLPRCREIIIPETKHCLTQETDAVLEQIYDEIDRLVEQITSEL